MSNAAAVAQDGAAAIAHTIDVVAAEAESSAASAQQTRAAAESLQALSGVLRELVSQFQV